MNTSTKNTIKSAVNINKKFLVPGAGFGGLRDISPPIKKFHPTCNKQYLHNK